jgi:hypothetical protein
MASVALHKLAPVALMRDIPVRNLTDEAAFPTNRVCV